MGRRIADGNRGPIAVRDACIRPHGSNHKRNRVTCDVHRDPKCDFTYTGHLGYGLCRIDRDSLPSYIHPQARGGGAFDAGSPHGNRFVEQRRPGAQAEVRKGCQFGRVRPDCQSVPWRVVHGEDGWSGSSMVWRSRTGPKRSGDMEKCPRRWAGHRNSSSSVDVDGRAYASFTSTRVPPKLPLRPDRSVRASPLKNQPEIAAIAQAAHTGDIA